MAQYDGSINIDTKINNKGFNQGVSQMGNGLKGLNSLLGKTAALIGVAFGIKAIIDFGKSSVEAATNLTNAMMGLQSIVEGQGRSFSQAKGFIEEYTKDGLIPATDAITAYKNLASREYTDIQIEQTLQALKDSAAFGRQASLNLGQAVAGATEGLKNENSLLVKLICPTKKRFLVA